MTDAAKKEHELVEWAASFGPLLAENAERHDRDGTFVTESHTALKDAGLLAIGVPEELGGRGATYRQIAMVQRELAKYCASTALSTSMHQHIVAFAAWRYARGIPGAEPLLRRVLDDKIVLVSTGGADWTRPRGTVEKVDGGYRVNATKIFCSQSPVGDVMSTMFPYEDPEEGLKVLMSAVPISAEGVTVQDNWNSLGMRGTGSNDIVLENVFVADAQISGVRPHGVMDPPLQSIATIALSIISGCYLGVAEGAYGHALKAADAKKNDQTVQRQIGLMASRLRVAAWALDGAIAAAGDNPDPSMENVAGMMAAKREISLAGLEVCDLAMEVVGGASYFKGHPVERAYRDIRAIKFHPMPLEVALIHAGQVALGLPADAVL